MIRSNTSITGPTVTTSPVSSNTSRAHAASSVSPSSTPPPGRFHCPLSGSCARFTRTMRPSRRTTAPTPRIGLSGYFRPPSSTLQPPSGPHHLDDHALLALAVELRVEHLLPRPEIERALRDRQHHLVAHQ